MPLKIVLLEPFFAGSHAQWATQLKGYSSHQVDILSLPGRYWKWRMHGAAVTLAQQFLALPYQPDLILATDMLDLTTFLALTRPKTGNIPIVLYFHENQLTYPWSPTDPDPGLKRNNQYGFINYTSALSADAVCFNSDYHYHSFLNSLSPFLKQFPDHHNLSTIDQIQSKSSVLPLGLDLQNLNLNLRNKPTGPAVLLWNHRWEYDKNPLLFFKILERLQQSGVAFKLIVLGKSYAKQPAVFSTVEAQFSDELIHFGYAKDLDTYRQLLWQADILPVSSNQDFFGISVVEAIFCNCFPILPNRLAYPAHIPESRHPDHLYDSEESFFQQLKTAIHQVDQLRDRNIRSYVDRYDWKNMISVYDAKFEALIQ
jgi:glycosyltransferase involved in cell wall biosynthesis